MATLLPKSALKTYVNLPHSTALYTVEVEQAVIACAEYRIAVIS